jgi:hypothetical protein
MAAAMGVSLDIPIILRCVACHLNHDPEGRTMMEDHGLLLALDAGTDPDDLSRVADSYFDAWWTQAERNQENPLSFDTMAEAINHHRSVTGVKGILPLEGNKKVYTWSRHLEFDPKGLTIDCKRCRLYRGVTLGVLDNLQDLRHQVHALEVASEFRADMSERRAAGFFQLYDEVSKKEQSSSSNQGNIQDASSTKTSKKKGKSKMTTAQRAAGIQNSAAAGLVRLEDQPSLKWTWGPDLSVNEVLNLGKQIIPTGRHQHSGYNRTLPWGPIGEGSMSAASPSSSQVVSDIADDNMDVPNLKAKDIPSNFHSFPLRQSLGDPPPLNLPRYSSPSVTPSLTDTIFPFPPGYHRKSSDEKSDSTISVAAMDVYSDRSTALSDKETADVPAAITNAMIIGE